MLAKLVLAVAVVASVTGAAAVAADGGNRMTICHQPGTPAVKTMEVPRSAWDGHRGHGDHEGACTRGELQAGSRGDGSNGPADSQPQPVPRTTVFLTQRAEGDGLDGDARFVVKVSNGGPNVAHDLHLRGTLKGDGRWTVEAPAAVHCSVRGQDLDCSVADLGADSSADLVLKFEGPVALCREVGTDLKLTSSNDATTGDDHVAGTVRVGACSPL